MARKKKVYWYTYSTYHKDEQKDDAAYKQIGLCQMNGLLISQYVNYERDWILDEKRFTFIIYN
jgi:hypothetical protein